MLNRFFKGIFGHFFLRVAIIQTLVGVLTLAVLIPYYDYASRSLAAEQGRTLSNSTLSATTDALYDENYSFVVEHCLNVMKATPNVLSMVFSHRNGDELIVKGHQWQMQRKSLPYHSLQFNMVNPALSESPYVMDYRGLGLGFSDYYNFSRPVYISGKDWGVLTISFSTSAYLDNIKTFNQLVLVFTILSTFMVFVVFFYSSSRIRKQIDVFSEVAKKIVKGDLTAKAPEAAIGEIGLLSSVVNHLSRNLFEKSQRLDQLVKVVEQTQDAMLLIDNDNHVIFSNTSFNHISGYSAEEVLGISIHSLFKLLQLPENLLDSKEASGQTLPLSQERDFVIRRGDQSSLDVAIRSEFIASGAEKLMLLVISDISARKHAETELRIAATAFESQEGMIVTDAHNIILRVNHAVTKITGYSAAELIGQTPKLLNSGRHDRGFYREMWTSIENVGSWEGEIWNCRKDQEIYPQHLTITAVKDADGVVTNYVATLMDITSRKVAEEKIQHLAFYDSLTGLPNRRLFIDRLSQAIANGTRSGKFAALLFLDLDHFKTLNDTLGHDVGDMLLQQVAVRLNQVLREGDTVARLGGDEFVLLLEGLAGNVLQASSQAEEIAGKVSNSLNMPYLLGSHEYFSTPSIGATIFADHLDGSADDLLKQADIAMYQAKTSGRNAICFYDPEMQACITERAELEIELRKAIAQQEFKLYFQVQIDANRKASGAEALIRWQHPKRGLVSPAEFIPLAEDTGLILPIGQWVLDAACAQLSVWQHQSATGDITLSVNVSAKQFYQKDFAAQVISTIHRYGIRPDSLKLELTESLLLSRVDETIASMAELKQLGVMFSLDDFGTGYSSLQYLKNLPLYQLKIDQSFVRELSTDESDQSIVTTIVAMAKGLKLEVIAEGVETTAQYEKLIEIGCTHFQGYLFGRPLPLAEFEQLLAL